MFAAIFCWSKFLALKILCWSVKREKGHFLTFSLFAILSRYSIIHAVLLHNKFLITLSLSACLLIELIIVWKLWTSVLFLFEESVISEVGSESIHTLVLFRLCISNLYQSVLILEMLVAVETGVRLRS